MTTGQELARQGQDDALAAATVAHLRYLDNVRHAFDVWVSVTAKWPSKWGGFTAEDVRTELSPDTREWLDLHPNLLPAMFGAASRVKRIECIGRQPATRPSRHANEIRIWKGTGNDRAA